MIKSITYPSFERVKYDLRDYNLLQRMKFVAAHPPRLILKKEMIIFLEDGTEIVIPEGFITDGASVPRWFWAIPGFSPFGVLLDGAIPHDFGYQYGYFLVRYSPTVKLTTEEYRIWNTYRHLFGDLVPKFMGEDRKFFDAFMKGVCSAATGDATVSSITYGVLRLAGHKAWNNYRNQGPGAYNYNTLNLPGLNHNGVIF